MELGKIVGFLTGHCNVMYHNKNKDPNTFPDNKCRLCQADESIETVWHLVARCPVMISVRTKIWQRYDILSNEVFEWKLKDIRTFINDKRIKNLLKWNQ